MINARVATIIDPLRRWLLNKGKCSGCGRSLFKGRKKFQQGVYLVTCLCRRIFVYDPKEHSYQTYCQKSLLSLLRVKKANNDNERFFLDYLD